MKLAEMRSIAMGATRSKARAMGIDPTTQSADDMLTILDDVARVIPDAIACQWYSKASEHQIRLFRREWTAWVKRQS